MESVALRINISFQFINGNLIDDVTLRIVEQRVWQSGKLKGPELDNCDFS